MLLGSCKGHSCLTSGLTEGLKQALWKLVVARAGVLMESFQTLSEIDSLASKPLDGPPSSSCKLREMSGLTPPIGEGEIVL